MTSFQLYPTTEIVVNRDMRHRREIDDVEDLANSIATIGLINPLVIDRDGTLIAGERRLTACLRLGLTSVPVHFKDDLSASEREQIELDENIKRKDLTWQDRCNAILRYHEISKESVADWTQEKTAELLNISVPLIQKQIAVARELRSGDEQLATADRFSTAYGILERRNQRRAATEDEALSGMLENPDGTPIEEDDLDDEPHTSPSPSVPKPPIFNTDFLEWAPQYRGHKFNFIHCDFPYGIDADKHDQGAADKMGGYEDSEEVYHRLIEEFIKNQDRFVTKSAHCMFWFSMKYYEITRELFRDAGWTVNPSPLIWHKSDNAGILPDPKRGPRQVYETALLLTRGDRFIVRPKSNLFSAPTTKAYHMSEKNRDMLSHFFSMFVDDSTAMLDPTCGSGNSLLSAHGLGAKRVLGLERDKEFATGAKINWRENVLPPATG